MKKVLSLVFLILCIVGCTKKQEGEGGDSNDRDGQELAQGGLCGESDSFDLRITNGNVCKEPRRSPVALLSLEVPGSGALCSGTLITPTTILTAAHCVDPSLGITGVDGVGFSTGDAKKFEVFRAARTAFHKKWDGTPGNPYDVAVVILTDSVNSRIPVPLITDDGHPVSAGDRLHVYGYGKDEEQQVGVLKSGVMVVRGFNSEFGYPDSVIECNFDDSQQSVCNGDSGGSAVLQSHGFTGIVGITSAGSGGACLDHSVAFFTDVQHADVLNFIIENKDGPLTLINGGGASTV